MEVLQEVNETNVIGSGVIVMLLEHGSKASQVVWSDVITPDMRKVPHRYKSLKCDSCFTLLTVPVHKNLMAIPGSGMPPVTYI